MLGKRERDVTIGKCPWTKRSLQTLNPLSISLNPLQDDPKKTQNPDTYGSFEGDERVVHRDELRHLRAELDVAVVDVAEEEDEGETFGVLNELFRYDCNPPEYRKVTYPKPTGPNEVVATPVFYKDKVYVLTGQDPEHGEGLGTLSCIDPSKTGDISGDTVWIYKGIERSMSTPAIVDDLLYTADYRGFAYCFDAMTGEKYWEYDTFGHIWGSILRRPST